MTALADMGIRTRDDLYKKLNEGVGGAYERIAYTRNILRIAKARGHRKVLEYEGSYIAGLPGFNSCLLARAGMDVTVSINPRDYPDSVHAWELLGLMWPNVHLIEDDGTLKLPEKAYDFVYNHLAFEHFEQPQVLLDEMARLSRDVVMNLTLAPYNPGFLMHRAVHTVQRKPWDHGCMGQMTIGALKKGHHASGLSLLETGAADVPPWIDTVDSRMAGSMTYAAAYGSWAANHWVWCSADPNTENKLLVKLFWHMEQEMPRWFQILVGHHLFAVSTVK